MSAGYDFDALAADASDRLGVALDARRITLLERFTDALLSENRHTNLTRIASREEVLRAHFLDSFTVLAAAATHAIALDGAAMMDLGSGGGLPGIPLAVAQPGLNVTLCERRKKKAAFLERTVATLELRNVAVFGRQAAEWPATNRPFDLVVARAVADAATLVTVAAPLLLPGGRLMLMKTVNQEELQSAHAAAAKRSLAFECEDASPLKVDPDTRKRIWIFIKRRA